LGSGDRLTKYRDNFISHAQNFTDYVYTHIREVAVIHATSPTVINGLILVYQTKWIDRLTSDTQAMNSAYPINAVTLITDQATEGTDLAFQTLRLGLMTVAIL
jgi:hypothetical protein